VDEKELREKALRYIEEHFTMTLATFAEGRLWAAPVFYASSGFTLYFVSNPNVCLHSQNIEKNPVVAITIYEDYRLKKLHDWKKIKGIQMLGKAKRLEEEEEIVEALRVYVRKYPFTAVYFNLLFKFPKAVKILEGFVKKSPFKPEFTASFENSFYKVDPLEVWFVDNEVSFERRQKVPLLEDEIR
jgi:uncharacterized protein YhbP (UPF0306 family)